MLMLLNGGPLFVMMMDIVIVVEAVMPRMGLLEELTTRWCESVDECWRWQVVLYVRSIEYMMRQALLCQEDDQPVLDLQLKAFRLAS